MPAPNSPPSVPQRSTTAHGFTIYDEFHDTYGASVRIQQSSAASEQCVWIFARGGQTLLNKGLDPNEWPSDPHLDVAMAQRIRDALDAFIQEAAANGDSVQRPTTGGAPLDLELAGLEGGVWGSYVRYLEQLESRLQTAEDVCLMYGWSTGNPRYASDREKATYMLWTRWHRIAGVSSSPADHPHLSEERIAELARERDRIREATLARIRGEDSPPPDHPSAGG
jgi:hypothetical protein